VVPPELVSEYELMNPLVAAEVIVRVAWFPKVIVIVAEVVVETLT
jgi:hypothetical protein